MFGYDSEHAETILTWLYLLPPCLLMTEKNPITLAPKYRCPNIFIFADGLYNVELGSASWFIACIGSPCFNPCYTTTDRPVETVLETLHPGYIMVHQFWIVVLPFLRIPNSNVQYHTLIMTCYQPTNMEETDYLLAFVMTKFLSTRQVLWPCNFWQLVV